MKKNEIGSRVLAYIMLIAIIVSITTACSTSTSKEENIEIELPQMTKSDQFTVKNIQWKFKTDGAIKSSPLCFGNVIFFGSNDGNIYAINIKTKEQIWKYNAGGPILSQVAANNDKLFFGSNGIFYALDINSGKEIWKYDTKTRSERIDEWDYHDASPVTDNNIVYFGSEMGFVYGIDMLTGKKVWEFETEQNAAVRSTPIICEGVMYFGDWRGNYYAVDINSKEAKWTLNYGQPFHSSSIISHNTIFFGGRDTKVHAVDILTGEEKWRYKDSTGSWITGDPIVNGGKVYFPTSNRYNVYAFNIFTGEVEGDFCTYKNSFSKPLIYYNVLYVTTGDAYASPGTGKLEAFDLSNNNKLWEVNMDTGGVFTSPVIVNDVLYYGCEDGYLYAVDIKN